MSEETSGAEPRRRVSITKLQRHTAAAVELIALCQNVTEDGSVSEDEVDALRQWLEDNKATDLPAHAFLSKTVEAILADGKVTAEEQRELYTAIETVLPPDIRESVRGKRVVQERAAKEDARREREADKQAERDARLRNRPLGSWDFMVAGVRYEGRATIVADHAAPGDSVDMVRDMGNRFSRNAVEVRLTNGMQIGFVPEEHAVEMAPLLDGGCQHDAHIKKILTGGRCPIPVVVASLYPADAEVPKAIATAEALHQIPLPAEPARQPAPTPSLANAIEAQPGVSKPLAKRSGCAWALAICILLGALLWGVYTIWR